VALFNLGFDQVASIYAATPLGAVRLTDLVGVAPGVGVAVVTTLALGGFAVASRLERRRA